MAELMQIGAQEVRVAPGKPVKLVVWDLDHTLWDGVLLEQACPPLNKHLLRVVVGLDELGVLQSIASRNDFEAAAAHLRRCGILEYFLAPRIGWSAKSHSVAAIAETLNLGLDSVLFVDDQDFELEEVRCAHPQVRTMQADHACGLLDDVLIRPEILTQEAPRRRLMYLQDAARNRSEQDFSGPPEVFLGSLGLELTLGRACPADLERAAELVTRTNQLNSTGIVYSKAELQAFLDSPAHTLLVARLTDRFGDYGAIGIALLEAAADIWTLKLILVSCRVLSRGIGPILLRCLLQRAEAEQVVLRVDFRDTGRNRPMQMALMMTGFTQRRGSAEDTHLYHDRQASTVLPPYLKLRSNW